MNIEITEVVLGDKNSEKKWHELEIAYNRSRYQICKNIICYYKKSDHSPKLINTPFYKYELIDRDCNKFRGRLIRIGRNSKGNYFIFENRRQDFSRFITGESEINCIFDPEKLPDVKKFRALGYDDFPSFHESHLTISDKNTSSRNFHFEGGFLPLIVDMNAVGILEESFHFDDGKLSLASEYFKDNWLNCVEFENYNNVFKITIDNNYIDHIVIDFEKLKNDPNTDWDNVKYKIEEYTNRYILICKSITFSINKNT